MKTQIDNLTKQLGRLEDKSKQREADLEKALAKLKSFYDLYNSTNDEINELVDQERSFSKGIGGDVDVSHIILNRGNLVSLFLKMAISDLDCKNHLSIFFVFQQIRAQQAQFKAFRTKYVDAVGKQVDECNKTGQGLIQSASNGVNTSGLEKDLEKLNDKWNALKQRVSFHKFCIS